MNELRLCCVDQVELMSYRPPFVVQIFESTISTSPSEFVKVAYSSFTEDLRDINLKLKLNKGNFLTCTSDYTILAAGSFKQPVQQTPAGRAKQPISQPRKTRNYSCPDPSSLACSVKQKWRSLHEVTF